LQPDINSLLKEERVFEPAPGFRQGAHIKTREEYDRIYQRSIEDPDGFWAEIAGELEWFEPWKQVLEWNEPFAKWFVGGKINISHNCVDRHLKTWRKNKAALIWEGEPGDTVTLTYQQLHREVCKLANVLRSLGVRKGDRVAIYMPMIPELPVAMLACARIGATHSIVFGGFSSEALKDRINDAEAKAVITADGGFRRGAIVELKPAVDGALVDCPNDPARRRRASSPQ
jgi:acetyl-CoA synthetase